jgi:hypothetical protein
MSISDDYPGGYSIEVLGQDWYFSIRALEALEVDGSISDAILRNCVMEIGRQVERLDEYFEVDYLNIPLRGTVIGRVVIIDRRERPT